jgi:hypothetical protein
MRVQFPAATSFDQRGDLAAFAAHGVRLIRVCSGVKRNLGGGRCLFPVDPSR